MGTFSGQFLGCKVSQTDLEALRERLARDGAREVRGGGDVRIVNGCCVTAEAVAKTRQTVRRALADGASQVIVTGCAARIGDLGLSQLGDRVQVVDLPSERVPDAVSDRLGRLGCLGSAASEQRRTRVRAFLKVQDGCSFACSSCVIPLVRGRSRSR